MPDIRKILDPLKVPDAVKADAWDAWHAAQDKQDFQRRFDLLAIPVETKAALWDEKFRGASESSPDTGIGAGMTGLTARDPTIRERVSSFVDRFGSSVAATLPKPQDYLFPMDPRNWPTIARELPNVGRAMLESQGQEGATAVKAARSGDIKGAVAHGLGYLTPMVGPPLAHASEQGFAGDYAGMLGTTAGVALQIAGPGRVAKSVRSFRSPRRVVQDTLDIGERLTEVERARINKVNAEAQAQFGEKAAATQQENVARLETYEGKLKDTAQANAAAEQTNLGAMESYASRLEHIARRRQRTQEQRASRIEEQNRAAMAEHEAEVARLTEMNEARRTQAADQRNLVNDVTKHGEDLVIRLKELDHAVRSQGSAKFEAVEKATEGIPANPEPIRAAVEHAKKNILRGSEESLKIFESILNDTSPADTTVSGYEVSGGNQLAAAAGGASRLHQMLVEQGAISPPESMSFRDLHGYYSELGMKASTAGNMPGDVYHALKYVREHGIGREMARIAQDAENRINAPAAGRVTIPAQLADARAFWHDYMKAFRDWRPVKKGGSPLARAVFAADPDAAVSPFRSDAGVRAVELLRPYSPELATIAGRATAKWRYLLDLPKRAAGEKALPEAPELTPIPEPPTEPGALPQVPRPAKPSKTPAAPKLKALPEPPEMQTVDPRQVKVEAVKRIADKLRGSSGWGMYYDLGALTRAGGALFTGRPLYAAGYLAFPITRRVAGAAVQRPSLMKWLTEPTYRELGIGKPPSAGPTPRMMQPPTGSLKPPEERKSRRRLPLPMPPVPKSP